MDRRAITATVAALLVLGLATPAAAAPAPPPGDSIPGPIIPSLPYYIDPVVTLPSCKLISTARALDWSTSTFSFAGDTSNIATHTGYGTQISSTHAIIEDDGHSCTFNVSGKNQLIISVTPMSRYDRSFVENAYLTQFGTTPRSIGGTNTYVHGTGATWAETSFLLEEGVWVSGKVLNGGDFFPAVLQDVADMVYGLND